MPETPRTIGSLAQLACTWEVMARKAGNVCPGREFPGLSVDDFLKSAAAIAPVLEQAPHQPLGLTILRCIVETRKVVNTNTNLGIVLLLAPLASIPLDQPLQPKLSQLLARTTVEDSRNVYAAIRLAKPGGLGEAKEQDVKDEPTLPLRDVMALAKTQDYIAAQYAEEYCLILDWMAPELVKYVLWYKNIEHAIAVKQLMLLAQFIDSLILRKLGPREAKGVKEHAAQIPRLGGFDTSEGRQAFRDFDAWLRADNHARNPGTLADLIAASLFVALREKFISPTTPFTWDGHPFQAQG